MTGAVLEKYFISLKCTDLLGLNARNNTPGTAGGPGGRDRTLAVKAEKSPFFSLKNKI